MKSSPDRLAWTVLLCAFAVFCALLVGVPTAILTYVNNATLQPTMVVRLQAGKLITFGPTESENDGRVVPQEGRRLEEGSTIVLDNDGQSLASLVISIDETEPLAKINLYSGARLRVTRARLPRYASSNKPAELLLSLKTGRIQVQDTDARAGLIEVNTDQVDSKLREGTYSIEVISDGANSETNVTVREGAATVALANPAAGRENVLSLLSNQRVIARAGAKQLELSPPYRNLLRNSDWAAPIAKDWLDFSQLENDGDPLGTATVIDQSLVLNRRGSNLRWGRTGLAQLVNDDVKGRRALLLRLTFSILYQEVPVCGGQGSECPLLVKLVYRASDGGEREWVQGFYASGTPDGDLLPDYIRSVPPDVRQKHAKNPGAREAWESANLLTLIKDVTFIKSVSLYAEGHGVTTQVHSAELLLLD